ncbi:MAG TPA: 2-phospho-L-lactate guanylyltransferase [Anaerolineales bacterium]|nr:2-phospho-L-lactate guanylyltransferase [Anaerolineales bacterium]
MTLWAIVPVKPLRRGKSRLSEVLTQEERADLNRRLLAHTLDTLTSIPEIEHVLVVSRDQSALAMARDYGARTVQENGAPQLNKALARATIVAKTYATRGVLILPADLPLITAEDVRTMLDRANDPPVVVVAPDRHGVGTNALLVCPAGLIEYEFGPGSFQRHCEMARQVGARLEICEMPSLALDMDLPEDLEMVSETFEHFLDHDEEISALQS